MPVLNRRPRVLASRGGSARNSTESAEGMKEHLWVVDENLEKPQKEMDFPSATLGKVPSRSKSRNTLRINTYSKQDLHDRYLSSEEEPSPSPDDEHSLEDQLPQASEIVIDDSLDMPYEEFKTEIAVAVPILAFGRPKLIDITNLAPMHKRKRPAKPLHPYPVAKNNSGAIRASATATTAAPASAPPVTDENHSSPTHEASAEPTVPALNTRQLKRKESFSVVAPESWLPDDSLAEEEDERDGFADTIHSSTLYRRDYDPYSLDTPRRTSNRSLHHFSTRVLEIDDNNTLSPWQLNTLTPTSVSGTTAGWKGLTRSLSLVKRNSGSSPVVNKKEGANKKPKMIPRGASEREQSPIIPPFPFEGEVAVA
ncbi:hypothetical protein MMC07_007709 [Pseudocyphellaria aurata]|nr:hypothetical protein [Pseudocyphellaria aurata]